MLAALRFLWVAAAGYRLRPWRSPYLRWRMETYAGLHAEQIGFRDFGIDRDLFCTRMSETYARDQLTRRFRCGRTR